MLNESTSYADGSWLGLAVLAVGTAALVLVAITRVQEKQGGLTPLGWLLEKWEQYRCPHPPGSLDLWYDADKDVQFRICLRCARKDYPEKCDGCVCHAKPEYGAVTGKHCPWCDPFRNGVLK